MSFKSNIHGLVYFQYNSTTENFIKPFKYIFIGKKYYI